MKKQWRIGQISAEFIWRMETVLDIYEQDYDPQRPVICFDERPCQMLGDVLSPIPMEPGRAQRQDHHYRRNGTCAGGKAFCAGADLEEGFEATEENVRAIVEGGQRVFQKIENFPKPVVAAVTGYAFGGGFELMLSCDISVAEENATMGQPEILRGLMPGWGGTQKIPRIAGKNRAMEIMLLGGRYRAPELAAMGLVNRVAPRGEGLKVAKEIASKLAKQPPGAMALIKQAVLADEREDLDRGLKTEAENFAKAFMVSEWNKEG